MSKPTSYRSQIVYDLSVFISELNRQALVPSRGPLGLFYQWQQKRMSKRLQHVVNQLQESEAFEF